MLFLTLTFGAPSVTDLQRRNEPAYLDGVAPVRNESRAWKLAVDGENLARDALRRKSDILQLKIILETGEQLFIL